MYVAVSSVADTTVTTGLSLGPMRTRVAKMGSFSLADGRDIGERGVHVGKRGLL